jgi:8-oxo-dGTP diphosphatase
MVPVAKAKFGGEMTDQDTPDPRAYPDRPYVGVGAVIFRGDEVLLAMRGKLPRRNDWSIPGGAQEIGETYVETAIREVMEETGLEIEVTGLVDVVDAINRDEEGRVRYHYTLVDVVAEWKSGEAVAKDDLADAKWVKISEIDDFDLREATRDVIRMAAGKRKPAIGGWPRRL